MSAQTETNQDKEEGLVYNHDEARVLATVINTFNKCMEHAVEEHGQQHVVTYSLRGILSNQKSGRTMCTTCTMHLQCPSSHTFYDFVDCVVCRVNTPCSPWNQCEYWRELGWSLQKKDE